MDLRNAQVLYCQVCYQHIWAIDKDKHIESIICRDSDLICKKAQYLLRLAPRNTCVWCNLPHPTCRLSYLLLGKIIRDICCIVLQSNHRQALPAFRSGSKFKNVFFPILYTITLSLTETKELIAFLFRIWIGYTKPDQRFVPQRPIFVLHPFEWRYIAPEEWDQVVERDHQLKFAIYDGAHTVDKIHWKELVAILHKHPENVRLRWQDGEFSVRRGRQWAPLTSLEELAGVYTKCLMDKNIRTREYDIAFGYYDKVRRQCLTFLQSDVGKACLVQPTHFPRREVQRTFSVQEKTSRVHLAEEVKLFHEKHFILRQNALARQMRVRHEHSLLKQHIPKIPKRRRY